jgi:hypothetical protein
VPNECDDGASEAHSCADEMNDIDSANVRKAGTGEHAEKAHETKCAENEEDPEQWRMITHKEPL